MKGLKRLWRFGAILMVIACLLGVGLAPRLASASSEAGEIALARGTKLYLDGKYQEAVVQLTEAARQNPNDPEIWSLLGTSYLALRDYAKAKEALLKAVELDPVIPYGQLYLGVANYYLGDIPEAERRFNEAKKQSPNDAMVRYYAGLIAASKGQAADALTELETGMRLAPQFALGNKGYQEALKIAKKEAQPYYLSLATGIEYDDNIKVLPDRTTNRGDPRFSHGQYKGHKADMRVPIIVNGGYEPLRQDKMAAGLRYYGYTGLNFNNQAFNVYDQLGEAYFKYKVERLTINPFYAFDYTWLGGQPWSMFNSLGMRLTLAETSNWTGDAIYMYQFRDFKNMLQNDERDFDRTGSLNQVGLFQTVAGNRGSLRLGLVYERELSSINFSSKAFRIPVEGYIYLPWKLLGYGYFEYAKTMNDQQASFKNTVLNQDFFQVVVQLRRPVTSYMNVIVGFNHISNPANIQDFQYNRNIYQVLAMFYY